MGFLLALLEKFGLGALSAWLGHKTDVAKDAGKVEQQRDDAQQGQQAISEAHQASEAVLRGAIDNPGGLRVPSPDSRD